MRASERPLGAPARVFLSPKSVAYLQYYESVFKDPQDPMVQQVFQNRSSGPSGNFWKLSHPGKSLSLLSRDFRQQTQWRVLRAGCPCALQLGVLSKWEPGHSEHVVLRVVPNEHQRPPGPVKGVELWGPRRPTESEAPRGGSPCAGPRSQVVPRAPPGVHSRGMLFILVLKDVPRVASVGQPLASPATACGCLTTPPRRLEARLLLAWVTVPSCHQS